MYCVLAFLQSVPTLSVPDVVSTGMAGVVLYLWRADRADRLVERDAAEKRYQVLAEDFRKIVTENTSAITSLRESIINSPCALLNSTHPMRGQ